jgi:hypothetical protein
MGGLGCQTLALGNLVVTALGVGKVVDVALGGSALWCSIVACRDRAGDTMVMVCSTRLSSSRHHTLRGVLCYDADNEHSFTQI